MTTTDVHEKDEGFAQDKNAVQLYRKSPKLPNMTGTSLEQMQHLTEM